MASWEDGENGKYNPIQDRSILPTCTDDSQCASLNPFDIDKQTINRNVGTVALVLYRIR